MLLARIDVVTGLSAGFRFEPRNSIVSIGRHNDNDLVLNDEIVGEHHLKLHIGVDEVLLETQAGDRSTAILRAGRGLTLAQRHQRMALREGDELAIGEPGSSTAVRLALRFAPDDEPEPQVVATRPIGHWERPDAASRLIEVTATLSQAEQAILSAPSLEQIYIAVLDAALGVVPRATHASLILRDLITDDSPGQVHEGAFMPVMTRARTSQGELVAITDTAPLARSVFRRVIRDRNAVLVADAVADGFGSESLLGSNIRSTLAVPLWKGQSIIGVLELDNRARPAMFDKTDLDLVSIIAASASLAVSNAKLIEQLSIIEHQLRQENAFWRQRERHKGRVVEVIGTSAAMQHLMAQVEKVAQTRATVLIEGETGVGKELVAAAVHTRSPRRDKLYVAQNCATLPDNLLESELFGHKKGSFTGASEDKKGLFEIADGGTLFLDEITEIPLALQAKLLRVLQEGEVRPVGSGRPKQVDVRIIAASNRNLETEVHEGRFREDLYYRLNVFPLHVPALRERRDDIALLANHFLQRYMREFGQPPIGLCRRDAAIPGLLQLAWQRA